MATKQVPPKPTSNTAVTVGKPKLLAKLAEKYSVDADKMMTTLKATAFHTEKEVSNEQMMALLIVADQYNLNPWTKEIYAFVDRRTSGIIPVVGVDGWIRIINEHPQFAAMTFNYPDDTGDDELPPWIECSIKRKDREQPTTIREWYVECKRNTDPWNSHPRRMLRHKALVQCARVAFGFANLYDPDEAERIARREIDITPPKRVIPVPTSNGDGPALATPEQVALVRDSLKVANIEERECLEQFGGADDAKLEDLHFDKVNEVLAWIKQHAAQGEA